LVELPYEKVKAALSRETKTRQLAHFAVALDLLEERGHRNAGDAALAGALAEFIAGKGPLFGDAYRPEVKEWQKKAAKCGSWHIVLSGGCSP